ncbi:MAG: flagellar basal body L-ring protein FlgH [Anaerolineae bacterium]|nr:flagellar basal body L-ring protein FlgH [Phycisphaerae bacterium]
MKRIIIPAICVCLSGSGVVAQDRPQKPAASASPQPPAGTPAPPPMTPPAQTAQETSYLMRQTGGSLLQATMAQQADPAQAKLADMSFFAVPEPEPRTMRKHDLVTIIVREVSEYSSEGSTDLKKEADLDAKVDQFIRFSLDNFALKSNVGTPAPQITMSGERNFKGEATVDRSDSLIARITAEVVDVKPNGTLVLQARKRIKTDEEVEQFILTGICRAEDISADNTLLSTQLYDLELNKSHTGAVRDTTKRGWVPKLLDAINPF